MLKQYDDEVRQVTGKQAVADAGNEKKMALISQMASKGFLPVSSRVELINHGVINQHEAAGKSRPSLMNQLNTGRLSSSIESNKREATSEEE